MPDEQVHNLNVSGTMDRGLSDPSTPATSGRVYLILTERSNSSAPHFGPIPIPQTDIPESGDFVNRVPSSLNTSTEDNCKARAHGFFVLRRFTIALALAGFA